MGETVALVIFAFLALAAASTGAIFQPGTWYEELAKPRWTPPKWLFPVAWSVLYAMIAISAWLVWRDAPFALAALPLIVWVIQLALNAAWSWIFFGLRRIGLALAELVLLWLAIAATIMMFAPLSTLAALLLVPYLIWVSFAGALNLAILRLNHGRRLAAVQTSA